MNLLVDNRSPYIQGKHIAYVQLYVHNNVHTHTHSVLYISICVVEVSVLFTELGNSATLAL